MSDMDRQMQWPEQISRETELEQNKRAYQQRQMGSATHQELKTRQGLSRRLRDMLAAQADDQATKDDTSK